MAGVAPGLGVAAFKNESRAIGVVEFDAGPFFEGVTDLAFEVDIFVGHILRIRDGDNQEKG